MTHHMRKCPPYQVSPHHKILNSQQHLPLKNVILLKVKYTIYQELSIAKAILHGYRFQEWNLLAEGVKESGFCSYQKPTEKFFSTNGKDKCPHTID